MTYPTGITLMTLLVAAVLVVGCGNDPSLPSTPVPAPVSVDTPAPAPNATLAPTAAPDLAPTPAGPRPSIGGAATDRGEAQSTETAGQFDVSIWAPFAGFLEQQTLQANAAALDEVNFFWYTLGADGGIEGDIQATQAVQVARDAGLRIVPSIVNGGFDAQRVSAVINNPTRRAQHIRDILALVHDNNFDGIDIDYESLNPDDRDNFSLFVEELAAALHARGKLLSIAVHPKTSDPGTWNGPQAQDYARLGAAVDKFKIMTYDYHWSTSEAGPIAPLDWVDQVLAYAATVVPPEKTYLGVPFYGYDWTGSTGEPLNWRQATKLASQNNAELQRDASSGEAWFTYGDGRHTVYFNDAETLRQRLQAAFERHPALAGVAIWALGGEDPENWTIISQADRKENERR